MIDGWRETVVDFRISLPESRNRSSFFPFLSIINNRTMKIIWAQNTAESSRRHREGADQMGPACRAMRPGMRGMAEESAASYRPCCLSHCCRGRGTAPNCGKGRKKDKGEKPPACPGVSALGTARGQYGRTSRNQWATGSMSPQSSGSGAFTYFQMNDGNSPSTTAKSIHGHGTTIYYADPDRFPNHVHNIPTSYPPRSF